MITYNNKDILKSFIGNKRVIKKYLNNKIVYGIPDFAQYYNIQGYDNYEVVGSPTITDGVATGFNSNSYLISSSNLAQQAETECYVRVKIGQSVVTHNVFFGFTGGDYPIRYSPSYKFSFYKKNAGGWTEGITQYAVGDIVDVKYIYKDGYLRLYTKSASADLWTQEMQLAVSSNPIYGNFYFGRNATAQTQYISGAIDLNHTYIKVNGEYWFNGNPNYKELLDCNPNVYLQNNSNWNAYIDTGIIPSNNIKFEISAQLVDTTIKDGALLGCRKSSATTSNFLLWYNNLVTGYGAFNYGAAYKNNWSPGISDPYQKQTYLYNGNNVYINDVLQTDGYDANKSAFNTDLTIYLFGYRADNILQARTFRGRVYNFKFWDGDTLIQHLVPVPAGLQIGSYKVPSNGMFDIVTQTFFENKGSGEFIWGVDL